MLTLSLTSCLSACVNLSDCETRRFLSSPVLAQLAGYSASLRLPLLFLQVAAILRAQNSSQYTVRNRNDEAVHATEEIKFHDRTQDETDEDVE